MTKNEFIQHLEVPHYVNEGDIIGIQEVIKEFPYCQSAQVVLTKAFHVSGNLNFESQLKRAAAYAADRKQLHALLFEANNIDDHSEEYATSSLTEEIASDGIIEDLTKVDKNDILEQQILASAINSSILQEVPDSIPEDLSNKSFVTVLPSEPEEEKVELVVQASSFNENEAHSFSEWVNFYGDAEDDIQQNIAENSLWEKTSEESKAIITGTTNSSLPTKTEFYSATKMAKLSVQEDDDLVTETLANIYADQGSFEKAIHAFEKLQLKYPEKRVYFAGRIKEIQKSINS